MCSIFIDYVGKTSIYRNVKVYRYRCCSCRHTFGDYPAGNHRADQTQKLRKLTALGWVLGLSLRGAAMLFAAFGVDISHMSVWRDAQEEARKLRRARVWQPVRILGLDGAYVRRWGGMCIFPIYEIHPPPVGQPHMNA